MTRQLIFVHGRGQEQKNAGQLKADWISALQEGLAKSNLTLPVDEQDIKFPYYGQTLYDLVKETPPDEVANVIVRGDGIDEAQREFLRSVLEEVRQKSEITDEQIDEALGSDIIRRGPLNWERLQGIVRALDHNVPLASGASIAIATNDVYQYLKNPGIRDTIDDGVGAAMTPGVPTVVVSHSLGTVVSYNLLGRDGAAAGWLVPLFVTLGSPLAVTAIKRSLRPLRHPPCVEKWYNAMDERDIVALYPLNKRNFDVDPQIENNTGVDNETSNRHSISGYLDDKDVALRIYNALVAD